MTDSKSPTTLLTVLPELRAKLLAVQPDLASYAEILSNIAATSSHAMAHRCKVGGNPNIPFALARSAVQFARAATMIEEAAILVARAVALESAATGGLQHLEGAEPTPPPVGSPDTIP